jgi:hypothetical protein
MSDENVFVIRNNGKVSKEMISGKRDLLSCDNNGETK